MYKLLIPLEYLAGFVGALVVLLCMIAGAFIGLFDLPRYLRIRSM